MQLKSALHVNMQIVADNTASNKIKVTQLFSTDYSEISKVLKEVTDEIPDKDFVLNGSNKDTVDMSTVFVVDNLLEDDHVSENNHYFFVNLVYCLEIIHYFLFNPTINIFFQKMETMSRILPKSTFILAIEKATARISPKYNLFNIITSMNVNNHILVLVNTVDASNSDNITYLPIANDNKFTWIPRVKMELERTRKLMLVSERQPYSGLLGNFQVFNVLL